MANFLEDYADGVPFGPAAGAINGLSEEEIKTKILDVLRSPARAATWGSITWERSLGNDGRTFNHNALTGQTVNSMGLPNIGIVRGLIIQTEMQKYAEEFNKPLIISFSPGKGEDPQEVLPAMAYKAAESGVQIIEVNYSCPNKFIDGVRLEPVLSHDLEKVADVDAKILAAVGPDVTVIRKFAPLVGEKRVYLPETLEFCSQLGEKAVASFFNTIGSQSVLDEKGDPALSVGDGGENIGGLSGPATIEVGREGLRYRQKLPEHIGMISCLGVDSAAEVLYRTQRGADFAEGVTLFWENEKKGKSFGQTMTEIAEQYAELVQE
jgi:dihydroorotate dehydrogenase